VRALSILIKRQIVDDAPFFVSALVAAGIIVLILGCLAFIYPRDLFWLLRFWCGADVH